MEPTLSELVNINPDPGSPAPIIDNSALVDRLNQQSRYHAENQWRKYNSFLENKKDLFKNISDIQGLAVAPQDKEVLNKQAAEILGDILKNPSVALGGRGYDEVQSKIAKFKSSSMLSKQNKLDDDANELFMNRNPELYTEENKQKRIDFWKPGLGNRQSVMLDIPTILDEKTVFEGLIKQNSKETSDFVGKDGKPGEGYIAKIIETNPEAVLGGWNMVVKGGQQDKNGRDLVNAVKYTYSKLPPKEREKYEGKGGIEQYWADKADQYLKAYFPDGNYRRITGIDEDTNYLGKKRLEQTERHQKTVEWIAAERLKVAKSNNALGWEKFHKEVAEVGEPVDIFDEIDTKASNVEEGKGLPFNNLSATAQRIVLGYVRESTGDEDLNYSNIYIKKENGRIVVKDAESRKKVITPITAFDINTIANKELNKVSSNKAEDEKLKKTNLNTGTKTPTNAPKPKVGESGIQWKTTK